MLSCNINVLRDNVLMQLKIILNIISNSSVCAINRTLMGTTTPGQSGPGCKGNEKVTPHSISVAV